MWKTKTTQSASDLSPNIWHQKFLWKHQIWCWNIRSDNTARFYNVVGYVIISMLQ